MRLIWMATLGALVALQATRPLAGRRPARSLVDRPTFTRDIAPLVFDRCAGCHRTGGAAPFPLLTYAAVKRHAAEIASVTARRFMPPWKAEPGYGDFIGQHPLTDAEIALIQRWVDQGAVEGDSRDLPRPPSWTEGWQLGTPDIVVTFPEPYALRPGGTDVFRVFVVAVPLDVARDVRAVEFSPGNPKVVHHANIRIDRTPASRVLDERDPLPGYDGLLAHSAVYPEGHFLGWTPGQISPLLPSDLAWRFEPNTDLVIQLHMQPSGKPEIVQPSVGFYFASRRSGSDPPVRTPVMLRLGRQGIDIPAGEANYTITDSYQLPVDVDVLAVQPHAHYRAREIRGVATLPDGTTRWLIFIKDWDFRWQHVYRFVRPLPLPKGTTVAMRYTYDNSAENPLNPQLPPRRVGWGQRSFDEMGDLWIQMLARENRDLAPLRREIRAKVLAEDIVGYETMIRADPFDVELHDEVAARYLELGRANEAVTHFLASARLRPQLAAAHFNLGTALTAAGRLDEAIDEYRLALSARPGYSSAHNNLGNVLDLQGKGEEALEHYREAVRLDPGNAQAHYSIGLAVLRRGGGPREAVGHFRQVVRLRPDWPVGMADLAWLLATSSVVSRHDVDEAMRLAERAADLTDRRDARVLDVLAAAYAAGGRFERAIAATDAALLLKPDDPLASEIRKRRDLYKRREPYRAR